MPMHLLAKVFAGRRLEYVGAWGSPGGSCPAYIAELLWSSDAARSIGVEAGSGGTSRWDLWSGERIAGAWAPVKERRDADRDEPHVRWVSPDGRLEVRRAFGPILLNSNIDPFVGVRAAGPPLFRMVDRISGARLWSASPAEPYSFSDDGELFTGVSLELRDFGQAIADHAVVWRSSTGEIVGRCPLEDGPEALAVRRDGALLVSFSERGQARLWDLERDVCRWSRVVPHLSAFDSAPHGYDRVFLCIEARFSRDGEKILVFCDEACGVTLRAFSTADGALEWEYTLPRSPSTESHGVSELMVLSPDGTHIAVSDREWWSWSTRVRVLRTATGREEHPKRGHRGCVAVVGSSSDGRLIASGDRDGVVMVHACGASEPVNTFHSPGSPVTSLVFARDDRTLYGAWADGSFKRWDLSTGSESGSWLEEGRDPFGRNYPAVIESLALSEDGKLALVVGGHGVGLWDMERGERRSHILPRGDWHCDWAYVSRRRSGFFLRGRAFILAGRKILELRLANGALTTLLDNDHWQREVCEVRAITVTSRGILVAGERHRGHIGLWEVVEGTTHATHLNTIAVAHDSKVVFSPDGSALLVFSAMTISSPADVTLWDVASCSLIERLPIHEAEDDTTAAAFTGDGRGIVVGTARGGVILAALR